MSSRSQRLIDEFHDGSADGSIGHGIAHVLRHIADVYDDPEHWGAVPAAVVDNLIAELLAPTLLERAMAGDPAAAREVLLNAGLIDADGQLAAPYRPLPEGPPSVA
jgi:hypothetical protein